MQPKNTPLGGGDCFTLVFNLNIARLAVIVWEFKASGQSRVEEPGEGPPQQDAAAHRSKLQRWTSPPYVRNKATSAVGQDGGWPSEGGGADQSGMAAAEECQEFPL